MEIKVRPQAAQSQTDDAGRKTQAVGTPGPLVEHARACRAFRPKPTITDADRKAMFAALRIAARDIPSVRRFVVGARVRHNAG